MTQLHAFGALVCAGIIFLCGASYLGPLYAEEEIEVEPQATDPEHREWILRCIEKGNPRAEYRAKDLVKECTFHARNLFPIRLEE
jgi:hypothetical protein